MSIFGLISKYCQHFGYCVQFKFLKISLEKGALPAKLKVMVKIMIDTEYDALWNKVYVIVDIVEIIRFLLHSICFRFS